MAALASFLSGFYTVPAEYERCIPMKSFVLSFVRSFVCSSMRASFTILAILYHEETTGLRSVIFCRYMQVDTLPLPANFIQSVNVLYLHCKGQTFESSALSINQSIFNL